MHTLGCNITVAKYPLVFEILFLPHFLVVLEERSKCTSCCLAVSLIFNFCWFNWCWFQVTHADFKKAKEKVMFKKKEGVPEGLYMWKDKHPLMPCICWTIFSFYGFQCFDQWNFMRTVQHLMMHPASLLNKLELQTLLFLILFCSACLKCYEICALDAHCL